MLLWPNKIIIEFRGTLTKSLVDGREIYFFSDKLRHPLVYQSMVLILVMICLVVGVVSIMILVLVSAVINEYLRVN
jgi:hypothetical protein